MVLIGLTLCFLCGIVLAQDARPTRSDTPTAVRLNPGCLTAISSPTSATLLMVISPRMVYSMLEWPRMLRVALSAGFQVVTWRAQGLSIDEWTHAADKAGWPSDLHATIGEVPLACTALLEGVNHFPFSLVIGRDTYHAWPVWGVLSDEAWLSSLVFRRQGLSVAHTPVAGPPR